MKVRDRAVSLSATDLANHLSCPHLTTLDFRLANGEIGAPTWDNPHLRVLQQRGLEHERSYIENLRTKGVSILDLSGGADPKATLEGMKSGAPAIVQASFASAEWRGRADVLLRVEQLEKTLISARPGLYWGQPEMVVPTVLSNYPLSSPTIRLFRQKAT